MRLEDLGSYDFPLFYVHLAGWHAAEREAWHRTATTNTILINAHSKRKVTVEQVMGEPKSRGPLLLTKEAFKSYMRNRIAEADKESAATDALMF